MAGGRMKFIKDQVVRIITLDGKVSNSEYTVQTDIADGRGHVQLEEQGTQRVLKVNQRRIITQTVDSDAAIVVESSNKYRAVCPKCPTVFDITPDHINIECPDHGTHKLHWLGEKPVTNTTTQPADTSAQPAPTETVQKKEKKTKKPTQLNLDALKGLENCELWTKGNTSFNHEQIIVQTHTLVWTGDDPRKLCFNSYDGSLGKKGKTLPVEAFLNNDTAGGKWYTIKDSLEKERKRLTSKGYELSE